MARLKSGAVKLDVGEIKQELYKQFGTRVRLQGSFYGEIERIAREASQELIDEFNKHSSMRESQGSGAPYFRDPDIHRNVHNKPFRTATIQNMELSKGIVSTTVEAISVSNKGVAVDVFGIIDEGRNASPNAVALFPKTTGSLVKSNLKNINRVNRIFNPKGVRYVRGKRGIKMVFMRGLPEVTGKNLLGVLARDIEQRFISYRLEFIKGEPTIGRGLIKVKVKR